MYKTYESSNKKIMLNLLLLFGIIISILFLSIGYAAMVSTNLSINATAIAGIQDDIFISDVVYKDDNLADTANSQIINYTGTTLHSSIYLSETDLTSNITYTITIFNNSNSSKRFIGTTYLDDFYSNNDIQYQLTGLNLGETIAKGEKKIFTITFLYNAQEIIDNRLDSFLSFNFEGETEILVFEHPGDFVFTGNNYINTQIKLFSEENMSKDFRIYFEIKEDDQTQTGYNTLLSIMDESGAPYPGFLFRVGNASSNRLNSYELTANSIAGKGKAYYNDRASTKIVEIIRVDNILYAKINDGSYEKMQDYTEFTNYFDVPVTFGASLNSGGNPFRYFKGILSNMKVSYLPSSLSEELLGLN